MTDGDGVGLFADAEVGTKSTLHISLTASNGKTEGNRDVVDDVLERIAVVNGAEKGWAMTAQGLVGRLTIGEVNVLTWSESRKALMSLDDSCAVAPLSLRQDANPDGRVGVVTFSLLDGLDGWNIIVRNVFLFLGIVVVLLLDGLLLRLLVKPGERMKSTDETPMFLWLSSSTNLERTSVKRLLCNKNGTYPVANCVPYSLLTELVTICNGNDPQGH